MYTLCQDCNNNTGSWFGNDYVRFTHSICQAIVNSHPKHGDIVSTNCTLYPLRVLKQISSMFCSVNHNNDSDVVCSLRRFVKSKTSLDFPSDIARIGMYAFIGGIQKNLGIFAVFRTSDTGNTTCLVSEIDHFPLGFVLLFNPDDNTNIPGIDITTFASYDYDQEANLQLTLPCYETNTLFPLDYRTQNDIIRARINERFKHKKL